MKTGLKQLLVTALIEQTRLAERRQANLEDRNAALDEAVDKAARFDEKKAEMDALGRLAEARGLQVTAALKEADAVRETMHNLSQAAASLIAALRKPRLARSRVDDLSHDVAKYIAAAHRLYSAQIPF